MQELTELQKAQLRFLKNTVRYYSKDVKRRASVGGLCYYDGTNILGCTGKGCAIGRVLLKRERAALDTYFNSKTSSAGSGVSNYKLFEQLPEKLRNLGQSFLKDVQCLHDSSLNWGDVRGLSLQGLRLVEYIKGRIIAAYYKN